jgi:hypothetical protein
VEPSRCTFSHQFKQRKYLNGNYLYLRIAWLVTVWQPVRTVHDLRTYGLQPLPLFQWPLTGLYENYHYVLYYLVEDRLCGLVDRFPG